MNFRIILRIKNFIQADHNFSNLNNNKEQNHKIIITLQTHHMDKVILEKWFHNFFKINKINKSNVFEKNKKIIRKATPNRRELYLMTNLKIIFSKFIKIKNTSIIAYKLMHNYCKKYQLLTLIRS